MTAGREAARGKQGGRTLEIQRLIGRSLRAVVDLRALGERSITIDCDVLQADGGTRTASITGAYVALADALGKLVACGKTEKEPVLWSGRLGVGRNFQRRAGARSRLRRRQSEAETDMNVVMNDRVRLSRFRVRPRVMHFAATSSTRCSDWPRTGSAS